MAGHDSPRERLRRALEGEPGGGEQRLDGRHVGRGRPLDTHQQQPSPPQQPELACGSSLRVVAAEAGAAPGTPAVASATGLLARTIALTIPSATACVGVTETSVRPTASSPARNSEKESAPAMQPAYEPRSARWSA